MSTRQLFLIPLFILLTTTLVLADFPSLCSRDDDCGPFAICYQTDTANFCKCRLGAVEKGKGSTGCEMKECRYSFDCSDLYTECDDASRLCRCRKGYQQNSKTQYCNRVSSSSLDCDNGFGFMWRWLGPLIAFTMLFPIAIVLIRLYMIRQVMKNGAMGQHQQMVAVAVTTTGRAGNAGAVLAYPMVPPPAYSPNNAYNANYHQQTQPQTQPQPQTQQQN